MMLDLFLLLPVYCSFSLHCPSSTSLTTRIVFVGVMPIVVQGELEMWVDIFKQPEDKKKRLKPPVKVAPRKPVEYVTNRQKNCFVSVMILSICESHAAQLSTISIKLNFSNVATIANVS